MVTRAAYITDECMKLITRQVPITGRDLIQKNTLINNYQ